MSISTWYTKKGYHTSEVGVPVRDINEAYYIETALRQGATYQKSYMPIEHLDANADHEAVLTASTNDVDRDMEAIDLKGLDIQHYTKNPVVCWAHNTEVPPIGKSLWTKIENQRLKSLVRFAKRPDDWNDAWFPDEIYELAKQGIVRGVSIGFLVHEAQKPSEKQIEQYPHLKNCRCYITKSSLHEISIVPVGCNQNALIESVSKGLFRKELYPAFGIDVPDEDIWTWDKEDFDMPSISKLDVLKKIMQAKK